MRIIRMAACLLAAALLPFAAGFAQAGLPGDAMTATVSRPPAEMVSPRPAQVEIVIAAGEAPLSRVTVYRENGALARALGDFAAGQSQVFTEEALPTEEQLDAGRLLYCVRYSLKEGASRVEGERSVAVPLKRLPAEPSVEFTRSMPVTGVKKGEEISVAYRVFNSGNVTLTKLRVSDELTGGVGELAELAPGEKVSFAGRVSLQRESASRPTLSYECPATGQSYETTLARLPVRLVGEKLEATLSADQTTVSPGGSVTLSFHAVNRGDAACDRLVLRDQTLGSLATLPGGLKPGGEYNFTKTVTVTETSTYLFTLSGVSAGGSPSEVSSNPLTVAVTPAEDEIRLKLIAEPSALVLDRRGEIPIRLTLRNEGEKELRGVKLSEEKRGPIRTLTVVPPGDTVIDAPLTVQEAERFVFLAEILDGRGGQLTILSNPVYATIASGRAATVVAREPSGTLLPGQSGGPMRLTDNPTTYRRMMVGAIATLVALSALLGGHALTRRRKRKKLRREKLRRLRRSLSENRDESGTRARRAEKRAEPKERAESAFPRKPGSVGRP